VNAVRRRFLPGHRLQGWESAFEDGRRIKTLAKVRRGRWHLQDIGVLRERRADRFSIRRESGRFDIDPSLFWVVHGLVWGPHDVLRVASDCPPISPTRTACRAPS